MNREIKIKVVTISNVDNRLIEISEPMSVKKVGDYIDERRDKDGVERYEYIQWTGLIDKNGKDIWEGDVCKNGDWEENANAYNYRIEVVEYIDKEACFRGWNFNIDGMTCEVIGNIYENPDLLNK